MSTTVGHQDSVYAGVTAQPANSVEALADPSLERIADALETLVAFCHEMAAKDIEQSAKSEADNMRRRAPGR